VRSFRHSAGAALLSGCIAAGLARGAPASAPGHPYGPPPGHTGGFGEPTCRACHDSEEHNAPGGTLHVEGFPAEYLPGRRYTLVVTLRRQEMLRAGFQLAIRYASGDSAGRQAGALPGNEPRIEVVREPVSGVSYAHQNFPGSEATDGGAAWRLAWLAPAAAAGGPVVLHISANAANDDNSPLGDYVYSDSATSRPRR
jgi:hypothetical protein